MARPKKIVEEGVEVTEEGPFVRTLYKKNGKTKPAKTQEIADLLETEGWEKV